MLQRANRTGLAWTWLLGVALVWALVVRLWGIWFELPLSYHIDEYHEVMRALQLGTGSFNLERTGKGGFYLLLFVEYGIYFLVLKVLGVVDSAREFGILFARDPSAFYLIGRATAAVLGALTVATVWAIGREAYSSLAGVLAAVLLAVNVLHADLSRVIGVDVPMTLLAAVALYFGLRVIATGRRVDYVLAGLFAGLATTTKLPAILLVVPLLVAHGHAVAAAGGGLRSGLASKNLWLAALAFAGVLLVTNPLFFVNLLGAAVWLLGSAGPGELQDVAESGADVERIGQQPPNLYWYYLSVLVEVMGWPLALAGVGGIALALWRRRPADVMLLSYAILHYLAIASTSSATLYYPRYLLPVIVVLAVLSGRLLAEAQRVPGRLAAALLPISVAVCIAAPAAGSLEHARALVQEDVRTVAKRWFEANVPAGSRVLIEGSKISAHRQTVRLQDSAEALRQRIEYWRVHEPKQAKYLEYQLAAHAGGGYDLVLFDAESIRTLEEYLAQDVEYFVVRPLALENLRKGNELDLELLTSLRTDPRVELLRRFEGGEKERLGAVIEIYRRRQPVGTVVGSAL